MECVVIQSRLIASVAYYRNTETLRVWFHTNRCAVHRRISQTMFRNLVDADSPGFYYSHYIAERDHDHPTRLHPVRRLVLLLGITTAALFVSGIGLATAPEGVVTVACRTPCQDHR